MADLDPDVPVASAPVLVLLCLVAAGGTLGSLARYGLTVALPGLSTTVAINVGGSFLLGALVAARPYGRWSRPFLGTGVLGGFTTMSTFAVQAIDSTVSTGIAYVVGTLALGLTAAELGKRAIR